MQLPAFCNTCGIPFITGFRIGGTASVTFRNSGAGPCPNCGGMGRIPDGTYSFVQGAIKFLASTKLSVGDLRSLAAVLEEVKKGGTTRRGKPLKTSRGVSLGLGVRNSIRWALNNDQRIWVWVVGMIVVINFVLARMETDAGTTDIPNETEAPIEQLISDEQMAELTATMEKLITEQDKPISPDEGGLNEG